MPPKSRANGSQRTTPVPQSSGENASGSSTIPIFSNPEWRLAEARQSPRASTFPADRPATPVRTRSSSQPKQGFRKSALRRGSLQDSVEQHSPLSPLSRLRSLSPSSPGFAPEDLPRASHLHHKASRTSSKEPTITEVSFGTEQSGFPRPPKRRPSRPRLTRRQTVCETPQATATVRELQRVMAQLTQYETSFDMTAAWVKRLLDLTMEDNKSATEASDPLSEPVVVPSEVDDPPTRHHDPIAKITMLNDKCQEFEGRLLTRLAEENDHARKWNATAEELEQRKAEVEKQGSSARKTAQELRTKAHRQEAIATTRTQHLETHIAELEVEIYALQSQIEEFQAREMLAKTAAEGGAAREAAIEASLYTGNPVPWTPVRAEAFGLARQEGDFIFEDIPSRLTELTIKTRLLSPQLTSSSSSLEDVAKAEKDAIVAGNLAFTELKDDPLVGKCSYWRGIAELRAHKHVEAARSFQDAEKLCKGVYPEGEMATRRLKQLELGVPLTPIELQPQSLGRRSRSPRMRSQSPLRYQSSLRDASILPTTPMASTPDFISTNSLASTNPTFSSLALELSTALLGSPGLGASDKSAATSSSSCSFSSEPMALTHPAIPAKPRASSPPSAPTTLTTDSAHALSANSTGASWPTIELVLPSRAAPSSATWRTESIRRPEESPSSSETEEGFVSDGSAVPARQNREAFMHELSRYPEGALLTALVKKKLLNPSISSEGYIGAPPMVPRRRTGLPALRLIVNDNVQNSASPRSTTSSDEALLAELAKHPESALLLSLVDRGILTASLPLPSSRTTPIAARRRRNGPTALRIRTNLSPPSSPPAVDISPGTLTPVSHDIPLHAPVPQRRSMLPFRDLSPLQSKPTSPHDQVQHQDHPPSPPSPRPKTPAAQPPITSTTTHTHPVTPKQTSTTKRVQLTRPSPPSPSKSSPTQHSLHRRRRSKIYDEEAQQSLEDDGGDVGPEGEVASAARERLPSLGDAEAQTPPKTPRWRTMFGMG